MPTWLRGYAAMCVACVSVSMDLAVDITRFPEGVPQIIHFHRIFFKLSILGYPILGTQMCTLRMNEMNVQQLIHASR